MDEHTLLDEPANGTEPAVRPDDATGAAEPGARGQAPGTGASGVPVDATAEPGTGVHAPGAITAGGPDETAAEAREPVYTAVEDWVTGYFLPMFRRTLGGEFRWCAQWWQHGEAISRLTCLWHAWEVLRHQPGTGIATWYRDHLDHQLPILMGARGPFYQCAESAHREPREAIAVPAPGDWWDTGDDDGSVPGGGAEEPGRGVDHDIA